MNIAHKRLSANGQILHYAVAGKGQPIVLIHGFPQTYIQWKALVPRLWDNFKMIVPNLRGIGGNPGITTGYDKHSLAADIRAIVSAECGDEKIIICGHDIGGHVGFAYALNYREQVQSLILINSFPPGTDKMNELMNAQAIWRNWFPADTDLAAMLITGRETDFIRHIIKSNSYDTAAISEQDIETYAAAHRAPGAMRAALEMHRTLALDGDLNRQALLKEGKLTMSVTVLASGCDQDVLEEMVDEFSEEHKVVVVEDAGLWLVEEIADVVVGVVKIEA